MSSTRKDRLHTISYPADERVEALANAETARRKRALGRIFARAEQLCEHDRRQLCELLTPRSQPLAPVDPHDMEATPAGRRHRAKRVAAARVDADALTCALDTYRNLDAHAAERTTADDTADREELERQA